MGRSATPRGKIPLLINIIDLTPSIESNSKWAKKIFNKKEE